MNQFLWFGFLIGPFQFGWRRAE